MISMCTLPKLNMENDENDGFSIVQSRYFLWKWGWFSGSMLNFRGVVLFFVVRGGGRITKRLRL